MAINTLTNSYLTRLSNANHDDYDPSGGNGGDNLDKD